MIIAVLIGFLVVVGVVTATVITMVATRGTSANTTASPIANAAPAQSMSPSPTLHQISTPPPPPAFTMTRTLAPVVRPSASKIEPFSKEIITAPTNTITTKIAQIIKPPDTPVPPPKPEYKSQRVQSKPTNTVTTSEPRTKPVLQQQPKPVQKVQSPQPQEVPKEPTQKQNKEGTAEALTPQPKEPKQTIPVPPNEVVAPSQTPQQTIPVTPSDVEPAAEEQVELVVVPEIQPDIPEKEEEPKNARRRVVRTSNKMQPLPLPKPQQKPICNYEPGMDTYIYHVVIKSVNDYVTKFVSYMDIPNYTAVDVMHKQDAIDILTKAFDSCTDRNIFVYASSICEKCGIIPYFLNDFLHVYTKDRVGLQNITILHETNDTKRLVFLPHNKHIFRKIVNVFPKQSITFHSKALKKQIDKAQKPTYRYDTTRISITRNTFFSKIWPWGNNVTCDIMFHNSQYYEVPVLQHNWWYTWYFTQTPCNSGRILQQTGTCWYNSTINSLFISPNIRLFLQKVWEDIEQHNANPELLKKVLDMDTKGGFSSCQNIKNADLAAMLMYMVKKIVVEGEKLTAADGNISAVHGAIIKLSELPIKKIPRGKQLLELANGFSPGIAIGYVMKALFAEDDSKYTLYNPLINNQIPTSNPYLFVVTSHDGSIRSLRSIQVLLEMPEHDVNEIHINNNTYTLVSCTFGFSSNPMGSSGHAVAGVFCNNLPYVVDSNGVMTMFDWRELDTMSQDEIQWPRRLTEKYGKMSFMGYCYAIYILKN